MLMTVHSTRICGHVRSVFNLCKYSIQREIHRNKRSPITERRSLVTRPLGRGQSEEEGAGLLWGTEGLSVRGEDPPGCLPRWPLSSSTDLVIMCDERTQRFFFSKKKVTEIIYVSKLTHFKCINQRFFMNLQSYETIIVIHF